ncbi:polyphenol oxidase family protein [Collinsella sp. AGMB00827]|uniref:Polyphenol oxidase family protein n=1 Tax=Collinsella ureilytica TaxID=2869515 RepID=A0ABS7MKL7_9ACTN|nr:polyphenol oxidase family protein [Collinsella urealyticum]MBY4797913.1 polyphenol oxidase family protein [Collinsella urealyticum]
MKRMCIGDLCCIAATESRLRFGFTERTGGVSAEPFLSLNLGEHVGDDPAAVLENRRRVLAAFGVEDAEDKLIVPRQVHGTNLVSITSSDAHELSAARRLARSGADGIICTAPGVPILLCFADCVPVILTLGAAFAVVHSGWRGTLARIAAGAALELARVTGCTPAEISAYIGPHIQGFEYAVSDDLAAQFFSEFRRAISPEHPGMINLSECIQEALCDVGVKKASIFDTKLSTASGTDRFFSYRAEAGTCGRHGAFAVLLPEA